MPHSLEVRTKAIGAYETGDLTQEEIAKYFKISISSFKRWWKKYNNNESIEPILDKSGRPSRIDEKGLMLIKKWITANPSITLAELCAAYEKKYKAYIGDSIMSRAVIKLKFSYKKLSTKALEANTDEVKKKAKHI